MDDDLPSTSINYANGEARKLKQTFWGKESFDSNLLSELL